MNKLIIALSVAAVVVVAVDLLLCFWVGPTLQAITQWIPI